MDCGTTKDQMVRPRGYPHIFVTLSIFPGSVTEDVHSKTLESWYPILLIACYNVFDLIGRSLTAYFLLENTNIALGASFARLLFYPLYLGCLHDPRFFRNEVVVASLTSLLGITIGYFTSVLMILAPKLVQKQHSETAGIFMVIFLTLGLAIGSACVRVNVGLGLFLVALGLFLVALLVVPLMDMFYIKGQSRNFCGFYVMVGLVGFSGLANTLVQRGLVRSAAVLPKRYTQAVVSGASTSGLYARV
ncbi:Equilibrative nucleotide transporter 1 [Bienertia sinuspersici]